MILTVKKLFALDLDMHWSCYGFFYSVKKVTLKVMHYNVLLHKKVDNCVVYSLWKVMHCVTFMLLLVTWTGLAYIIIFFYNKKPKS